MTQRDGRTVVLTEAAKELAAMVRGQLKGLEDFAGRQQPVRPFVIAAGQSLLEWYVTPRLDALRKALGPGRTISLITLRSAPVCEFVRDHRADVGLVRADAVGKGLATRSLLRVGYALYASAGLAGKGDALAVLKSAPLAVPGEGQARLQLEAGARKAKVTLQIALEVVSFSLAAAAVRTGGYAAVLPGTVPEATLGIGVVRMGLPWKFGVERQIVACWHPATGFRDVPAAVSALAGVAA